MTVDEQGEIVIHRHEHSLQHLHGRERRINKAVVTVSPF
jgi:hypothetical protein